MSLSLLLLLLLVCSAQASHYYGSVMTYYPKTTNADGSMTVDLHYNLNIHCGSVFTVLTCSSNNCGTAVVHSVSKESDIFTWCQNEGLVTLQVPPNAPFQLLLSGGAWINFIRNSIGSVKAVTLVEPRNRSDTSQANRSPQTNILALVRVPSNCPRDFNLLTFDLDGDQVKCRYANSTLSECDQCTPPSVLNLSTSCILSFSPTDSINEGPWAVQLVMEDFPTQNITLTRTDGVQTTITTNNAISQLPVQFVLRVDRAVPSCTEGLYLPKFLPPTPDNKAQLYAPVDETLEISINATANISMISDLLFSGPYNMNQTTLGAGQYILSWTPSENQTGESHPVCFVVQAVFNSVTYQSELRCVIVNVGYDPFPIPIFLGLRMKVSALFSLSEDYIIDNIVELIRAELLSQGLPSDLPLKLNFSTTAPSAVSP
ncbi:uncharacterized protein LOC119913168 isoform X2 [Micropterus salmoides]|uniref:uncharacterized protein LOC119913168 isoform X2 n=1 Tax=Micropterus salmoides TaxID=27706 RepID=UPI0018ECC464|nr:uncharacterized protein LOC119913168 isoform X2 [Micropterus salmoides]